MRKKKIFKKKNDRLQIFQPLTAYPAMYGPMAHHYGNDVTALTPGSTEGSAHGKPIEQQQQQKQTLHFSPLIRAL